MAERYNRLYNRVSENPIWTQLSPAVFKVFCGCLMKANYRDSKWYDGIAEIPVKRGSFITSRERLAEFCHVSPQQARDALEHLERLHVITRQGTNRYTVVTFCNYEQYNSFETASEPAEEPAKNPAENPSGTKEEPKRNQSGTTVVTRTTRTTEADNTLSAAVAADTPPKPPKPVKEPSATDLLIDDIADELAVEHPKTRSCAAGVVVTRLKAITKLFPPVDRVHELGEIRRRHRGWRESHDWTKDGGQYAKGLKAWLSPTDGLWRIEPPSNVLPMVPSRASPGLFDKSAEVSRLLDERLLEEAQKHGAIR